MKRWLSQLSTGGRTATLTKEQLGTIPVPSPACYDFGQIAALVEQAAALAHAGRDFLEHVRGGVGCSSKTPQQPFSWTIISGSQSQTCCKDGAGKTSNAIGYATGRSGKCVA
jgi:hypothetical protein